MALTKVAGDILDPGLSIAGVVTATAFDGPFRGGSSSDVTAGIGTFTQLDLNGNADISGTLTVHQNATFNGNVSIAKTLTYEDVTNIDSVGLVTARTGLHVLAGGANIVGISTISNSELRITSGGAYNTHLNYSNVGTNYITSANGTGTYFRGSSNSITSMVVLGTGQVDIESKLRHIGDTDTLMEFGTDTISFDTAGGERLRIKSDGKVGVGTDTPAAKLETYQSGTSGYLFRAMAGLTVGNRPYDLKPPSSNSATEPFSWNTGNAHAFQIDGTERLRITDTGKVGINSTSPSNQLDVAGGANVLGIYRNDYTGTGGAGLNLHFGGAKANGDLFNCARITAIRSDNTGQAGEFRFSTLRSGTLEEALRITTDGKVGINETTPACQLHVEHNNAHSSTWYLNSDAGIMIDNKHGDGRSILKLEGNAAIVYGGPGGDLLISDRQTERFRINSAGKVLVGAGCTDVSLLNVKGQVGFADDGTNAGIIISTDDANGAAIHCLTTGGFTNGSYGIMRLNAVQHKFTYGNTQRLLIDSTGLATFGGEIATAQDYPNYRPTLDFNFAAIKKLDPRITYYRTGPASYTDEFGKVVLVANNIPRFDHDAATRECKGLLIEESRKNYLENGDFVSSYGSGNSWSYGHGNDVFTASSGSQLSTNPDGTSPAYHYEPSSTAAHHRFNRTFTVDQYDTKYVVSVFAKRVTEGSVSNLNRYLEIECSGAFANNTAPTGHSGSHGMSNVTFDLQNVTSQYAGNSAVNANGLVGDPKIEDYGNGWYRCSYVFNPGTDDGSGSLTGHVWFGHPTTMASDVGNETGNGNPSFYLWGAMVEKGSFLTSYIPNHGAFQNTRGTDTVELEDQEFTEFYNQTEGTLMVDGYTPPTTLVANPATKNSISLRGESQILHSIRYVTHASNANNRYVDAFQLLANGTLVVDHGGSHGTAIQDKYYKHITTFKENDYAYTYGGASQVWTDTSGDLPEMNRLIIGETPTQFFLKRLVYYSKRLPNSQLTTLVS